MSDDQMEMTFTQIDDERPHKSKHDSKWTSLKWPKDSPKKRKSYKMIKEKFLTTKT